MKFIYLLIFSLLLIGFVHAEKEICIDFDEPSEPTNLEVTSSGTNIILTWDSATDVPDCSGIETYNIYMDGDLIATTFSDTLTFTDENVPYGTYSYSVNAVDKVAHNSGDAIKNDVVLSELTTDTDNSGGTTVSGGGGGSSYVCYEEWQCSEWSACANEIQTRTCTDTKKCGTTKNKPLISGDCSLGGSGGSSSSGEPLITSSDEEKSFIAGITGAVIGAAKSTIGIVSIIFALGIVCAFVVTRTVRKKRN